MARIRSVSPDLRTSETCAEWPREARYAWVLLWGYCDDYGRALDNVKVIAADLFPLDDDINPEQINGWLVMFEESGAICRYEQDGKRYLHCTGWSEYQKPQHPGKVRVPPCYEHEPAAHEKWSAEHVRATSRKSHEDFMSPSPTRGRGRGSKELSKEEESREEGEPAGAPPAPPLYPDHCPTHARTATPGNCGDCKDTRLAHAAGFRPALAAVSSPMRRCIVHDQSYTRVCSGCAADRKAADSA